MKRRTFLQTLNLGLATAACYRTQLFGMPVDLLSLSAADKDLAHHRIARLQFSSVKLRYPRLVGKNARLDLHGHGPDVAICVLHTDQGASGWASLRGSREDAERLGQELVGKSVASLFSTSLGTKDERYIAFDMALHDLAGVILQQPVYTMLGQKKPLLTDYYSGMIYFDDLEPSDKPAGIDKILEECAYDRELGYRQFKLKIGRGHKWMGFQEGLQRDIDVTRKVAEAFPDCAILVDGNNGFSAQQFIQYLRGIDGVDLFWIEEPFHETEQDYRTLRSWLQSEGRHTLLADGEADPNPAQLRRLFEQKLLDVHLTDIEGLGFTNWRRLMPELKQLGAQASPHAWGSLLKSHYTAHLAAGVGNTVTIEGVSSQSDDVDLSHYKIQNGQLVPPASPGFGMPLLKKI